MQTIYVSISITNTRSQFNWWWVRKRDTNSNVDIIASSDAFSEVFNSKTAANIWQKSGKNEVKDVFCLRLENKMSKNNKWMLENVKRLNNRRMIAFRWPFSYDLSLSAWVYKQHSLNSCRDILNRGFLSLLKSKWRITSDRSSYRSDVNFKFLLYFVFDKKLQYLELISLIVSRFRLEMLSKVNSREAMMSKFTKSNMGLLVLSLTESYSLQLFLIELINREVISIELFWKSGLDTYQA